MTWINSSYNVSLKFYPLNIKKKVNISDYTIILNETNWVQSLIDMEM